MERKHIPHLQFDSIPESGGGWAVLDKEIEFFCPNCRHWAGLRLHSIDQNGEVNASVACAGKKKLGEERVPCDYHEFVILDDWPHDWSKKAGDSTIT